jgi:cell division protein FtsX
LVNREKSKKMRYRFQNAISHISRAGTSNIMSIVGIAFVGTLLAALLLNHLSIIDRFEFKSHAPTLVAFLKDSVDESKGRTLLSQIEKSGQILAANYTSKAENLARGETEFRDLGILIKEAFAETKGVNPFPASLNIYVDEELTTRPVLEQIALDMKAYDEIEDVSLTGQGQLNDRLRRSERTVFIGIGIAVVVVWLIIGSLIKKTAIIRAEEIALMKLLGMPRHYLLTPFVVHGIFLGGLGAVCGLGCFYGMFHVFRSQLGAIDFLNIYQLISVVMGGMLIGLLVGFTTQQKYV